MPCHAALDVAQETTAICVLGEEGRIQAEKKLPTCPDAIAGFLARGAPGLVRVGMETGPLAVWLWNGLAERQLPLICLDARHANAALKMRAVRTDRGDAAGLARIVRTGWFRQLRIRSRSNDQIRSLLTSRETLAGIRARIGNELRRLLRTFGVLFGKRAGSFTRRASEIISDELAASPEMRLVAEALMKARASILDQIKVLDRRLSAIARETPMVRLFMTAPGVGVITALSVASLFDEAARVRRSSSAGACLGPTPRRYGSGQTSRNRRISRQGNQMARMHLHKAATTLLTRNLRFSMLKVWGMRLAGASGFRKARVAVARKLADMLHAMRKTNRPSRWSEADA